MRFRTTIELGGKTATGFQVPPEVVASLGAGKRPPVTVTINGYAYRSTVAPYSGAYYLPLAAEHRAAAGLAAGDEVDVELELDTQPREVVIPPDVAEAFAADPAAKATFDALSYSHKRRHILAIEDANTPETRQRRITKALDTLREEGER